MRTFAYGICVFLFCSEVQVHSEELLPVLIPTPAKGRLQNRPVDCNRPNKKCDTTTQQALRLVRIELVRRELSLSESQANQLYSLHKSLKSTTVAFSNYNGLNTDAEVADFEARRDREFLKIDEHFDRLMNAKQYKRLDEIAFQTCGAMVFSYHEGGHELAAQLNFTDSQKAHVDSIMKDWEVERDKARRQLGLQDGAAAADPRWKRLHEIEWNIDQESLGRIYKLLNKDQLRQLSVEFVGKPVDVVAIRSKLFEMD